MNPAPIMSSLFRSIPHLSILILNLLWMYLTLGYRVNRTRKAFEKQLTAQGMSKENAQQLSAFYEDIKNSITTTVKQGIARTGGFR